MDADEADHFHRATHKHISIPTVSLEQNSGMGGNSSLNTRKLVRICLALLHRLCKDSDCSKKLIVEAGAMKPLCAKWFESVRRRFAESDLILSLLKCLTLFHDTQLAFIEQDGDEVLHALVHDEAPGA